MEEDGGGSDGDRARMVEEDGGVVPCTLGIEVRDDRLRAVDEVEKGRRGWVIYFPPVRHNLSRGFSREHAESIAIEEEVGRYVREEKRTIRGLAPEEGWKKGFADIAAGASRWRYQETNVDESKVYLSYVLDFILCVQ